MVEWQLRIANGETLPICNQNDIQLNGCAFEVRFYAENCNNPLQLFPSSGRLDFISLPSDVTMFTHVNSLIRVDSGVQTGDKISVHYDPLISKLIVWASNRVDALNLLFESLTRYQIIGLPTNIPFLKEIIRHLLVENSKVSF